MNLDDAQKQKVREWIGAGLKLAEIQSRLNSELGLRLTYMEVRLLVDDLKLVPKDAEPPAAVPADLSGAKPGSPAARGPGTPPPGGMLPTDRAAPPGGVAVNVDKVTVPGSIVSGGVTFSDGKKGRWFIDEMGQLGLAPEQKGYRPSQADMQAFQTKLQEELQRSGF